MLVLNYDILISREYFGVTVNMFIIFVADSNCCESYLLFSLLHFKP